TGNGITGDDTPLAGVKIFIDLDKNGTFNWTDAGSHNGVWDAGEGDRWTTTDANGKYSFTGLDYKYAGDKVYEVLPSGYTQTVGAHGYTITGTSGTNQDHLDFANFKFVESGYAWTKGFWGQHLTDWDGIAGNDPKAQNLVTSHVLAHTDIFTAGGVDSDHDGAINPGVYGVLLGDSNGDFKTDNGEDTLFVSLAA